MSHALGLSPDADSRQWRSLFDVVICSANKPSFFTSNRSFRLFDMDSRRPSASPVTSLVPGQVLLKLFVRDQRNQLLDCVVSVCCSYLCSIDVSF